MDKPSNDQAVEETIEEGYIVLAGLRSIVDCSFTVARMPEPLGFVK